MSKLRGLEIVSDISGDKEQILEFKISSKNHKIAAESLLNWINSGSEITLIDNRNNREGSISLKKINEEYLKSSGGHGFYRDWKVVTLEDVIWLIKSTAQFNTGGDQLNYGKIKNS